jgi:energy-coupling factor transporter ATP-binding protein EcfA2
MSSVLDEILEWSRTRPLWQRDALRRLVTEGQVDDEAVQSFTAACLGEDAANFDPLDAQHIRATGAEPVPVAVLGIRDAENVNSLATGEHLTFAPSGLTIVYGDNASGKSGYARILKAVTRTRASERVRNNIFLAADLTPRATIDLQVDQDDGKRFEWHPGVQGDEELSRLSFFDQACGDVYLSRETEVAFRPFGLGLFDELVTVCERVRAELDKRATDIGRRTAGLPALDDSTEAGRFLQGLRATTTDEEIKSAATFDSGQQERLKLLIGASEHVRQGTARAEAQRLERLAQRGDRVRDILKHLGSEVSVETRDNLIHLRDDAAAKTAATRAARAHAIAGTSLDGVGEAAWRELWEAARVYSQTVAYPNHAFPVIDDAVCVLCQQPLGPEASERLRGFEAFVRDTTQQAAQRAETAYRSAVDRVKTISAGDQATSEALSDLRAEDAELADAVELYLRDANECLEKLRDAIEADEAEQVVDFPEPPTARVDEGLRVLRERAAELLKSADANDGTSISDELNELNARNALADAYPALIAERDRLSLLRRIGTARSAASTNAVTQKGVELTNAALTDVLMDRFSRETDRLGLENVVLRTVGGRRGILRYRAGFVGAVQDAPLPEVLSEGEQTALGMAGFLAEVRTDASKSGVVFDDPVSSLDHERRDKVAQRLVGLASERQTIVFTHDVAFVLALKKHAVHGSVEVTERSIERLHARAGHCEDFHKFSAKLMKERLKELENHLSALRSERESMTNEEYRDATAKWYRLLRKTWERAIEETIVGDVLTRDDLQVHPMMVRTLVLFTADDNRVLQHGYGRATEMSEAHDESAVINSPPPSIDDLASDLEEIRDWHKRIAGRKNLSEQKVYDLAAAGT